MSDEKWLDSAEIISNGVGPDEAEALVRTILAGNLPIFPGVTGLELTNYERSAVVSLVEAINTVRGFCGVKPITISSDRVCLVGEAMCGQVLGAASGIEVLGRIYLRERLRRDAARFAYVLSHEMSHTSSFRAVCVELAAASRGPQIESVTQTRSGLQKLGAEGPEFVALNESVTEYLALLLRREAGKTPGPFGKDCLPTRDRIITMTGAVSSLLELAKRLTRDGVRPEWRAQTDVWRTMLIDYWLGSDVFLDTLKSVDISQWEFYRTLGVGYGGEREAESDN